MSSHEEREARATCPEAIKQESKRIKISEAGIVGRLYFGIEVRNARGALIGLELVRARSESEAMGQMRNKHGDDARIAIVGEGASQ